MISKVYILGDLADPINCKVVDADTGNSIDDVFSFEMVNGNLAKSTLVTLHRNQSATIRAELVPRPKEVGLRMSLSKSRAGGTMCADQYRATIDGGGKAHVCEKLVDDQMVAQAINPQAMIHDVVESALLECSRSLIRDYLASLSLLNGQAPKFQAGGLVPGYGGQPAQQHGNIKPSSTTPTAICPDCKGTGRYQPFTGPEENCKRCGGGG